MGTVLQLAANRQCVWTHSHVHNSRHTTHCRGEHLRTSHHLLSGVTSLIAVASSFLSVLLVTSSLVLEELWLTSGHLLLHEHLVLGAHSSWSSTHHVLLVWEFLSLSAHHWLTAWCHWRSLSWCWWLVRLLWLLLICVHFFNDK